MKKLILTAVILSAVSLFSCGTDIESSDGNTSENSSVISEISELSTEKQTQPVTESPTQPPTEPPYIPQEAEMHDIYDRSERGYWVNLDSYKFHLPECSTIPGDPGDNWQISDSSREDLIASGFDPCGRCRP